MPISNQPDSLPPTARNSNGTCPMMLSSYRYFVNALRSRDSNNYTLNNRNISIVENLNCWKDKKARRDDLVTASIANKTPIAQFIVDVYCQYALKHSASINDFMENSQLLNLLYEDKDASSEWNTIRQHLSDYVKYIYKPIHKPMLQNKHTMPSILSHVSLIHSTLYALPKVSQIDVVFMPQQYDFKKCGMTYATMRFHDKSIAIAMKRFNNRLKDDGTLRRCVICVMEDDKGYIFEPLTSQSLPSEVCDYTEMPWICNTKSNILPNFNANAICVSFHRHTKRDNHNMDTEATERVYLSYGSYCTRVFKHNLMSILRLFCAKDEKCLGWDEEVKTSEFKDDQYQIFMMTYFADMKLVSPDLNSYWRERMSSEHRWSKSLSGCFVADRARVLSMNMGDTYMYRPTAMEYYEYINDKVNDYYASQGIETRYDQFITYIVEDELEDCSVEDHLGLNQDVGDCVLLEFDTDFPMMDSSVEREEFVFRWLQSTYFFLN